MTDFELRISEHDREIADIRHVQKESPSRHDAEMETFRLRQAEAWAKHDSDMAELRIMHRSLLGETIKLVETVEKTSIGLAEFRAEMRAVMHNHESQLRDVENLN